MAFLRTLVDVRPPPVGRIRRHAACAHLLNVLFLTLVGFLAGLPRLAAGADVTNPPLRFDGPAAWRLVQQLATQPDGSPRTRVPGTPSHENVAKWLASALSQPGWEVRRMDFSGADYLALEKGGIGRLLATMDECAWPDRQRYVSDLRFHNLIATWQSPRATPRWFWLGAHWDSKALADQDRQSPRAPMPGANDGASGVGVLLQLIHHITAGEVVPQANVGIVLLDGEDGFDDCYPLAGSVMLARTKGRARMDRFVLLDMVGDVDARFVQDEASRRSDPALLRALWRVGARLSPKAFTAAHAELLDDHVPLAEVGIPSIDLVDAGRPGAGFAPWWHTTDDTMAHVDPRMLAAVGNAVGALLQDADLACHWPKRGPGEKSAPASGPVPRPAPKNCPAP